MSKSIELKRVPRLELVGREFSWLKVGIAGRKSVLSPDVMKGTIQSVSVQGNALRVDLSDVGPVESSTPGWRRGSKRKDKLTILINPVGKIMIKDDALELRFRMKGLLYEGEVVSRI